MNRQQLLSRLADRGWTVKYSSGRPTIWDRGSAEWDNRPLFGTTGRRGSVYLDMPGRLDVSWPRLRPWDRMTLRRHARRLTSGDFEVHWQVSCKPARILYLFHPKFFPYSQLVPHDLLVYHAYDSFSRAGEWTSQLADYEAHLFEHADIVFESAKGMIDVSPSLRDAPAVELLNGADAVAFAAGARSACPEDLRAIPHPRVGYTGRLTIKIDFPLIAELARREP